MSQSSGQLSQLIALRANNSAVVDGPLRAEIKAALPTVRALTKARYKTAHYPEHGLIIILVSPGFVRLRSSEQPRIIGQLQEAAKVAGFVGTVVPVWRSGDSFDFICPAVFEKYIKALCWNEILARVDGELTCE